MQMTTIESARSRAEDVLHNLQKKAREFLAAEDGLVKTLRELADEKGFSPAETRKKLEEMVGHIKANKIWDRVKSSDAAATFSDYRDEVERRVEDTMHRFIDTLSLVSKSDFQTLAKQVTALNKKLNDLSKKLDGRDN
jgi:polyhydroxyalkanoate synthesis regulator phasin